MNVGVNSKQPVNTTTAGLLFLGIFIPELDIINYPMNMLQFLVSFVPRNNCATHKLSIMAASGKRDDFASWSGRSQ